ncbi:hypothetical protein RclHR1_09470008 [Rhizophagus clarus]|uniref:BTB domain-containing protein n=1 Tax=Rhizophagus clarus TaxID=94130 RepID=A0A2Z6S4I6_9GLOM|nr:hypothetical protein RclHR1_09470008 [Rhizophagus clarus]GES93539.1 hypothetical protein GLOIN_2v1868421 [Rhizophagus clarus]
MSAQFFTKLSQNYIELLKDDEYYDVTIEVDKDPNVKIFRTHMNILCHRSPYLRRILASNKKNNDNGLTHITLPNIPSEIFQIILEYIYGGILSLNVNDTSDLLKILVAADNLYLQELVDYLQKYLIENKSEWIEQHFGFTQQVSSQSNNLLELQEFCTNLMAQSPEKIFKSFGFASLSEKSLISLIKKDDLQMNEIEIWEHVLKWGLAQNSTLIPDPKTWSDDDFKTMKNILQHCLPLIRFFGLSSREFSQKVRPYQKLLDQQVYEELLNSYLEPGSVSNDNILRPRKNKINEIKITDSHIIDSQIVDSNIVSTVSKWVDKVVINNDNYRGLYLPYKFELLLRGSRDGFTPKKFHELCDDKPNTVTFIKVKGTKEILGGYNPITWQVCHDVYSDRGWGKTKDSFIFSFKNENIKDVILSKVINGNCAIDNSSSCGPQFGKDLRICSYGEDLVVYPYESNDYTRDFNVTCCKKIHYDKMIRDTEDFSMEDYEVFQLIRK